MGGRHLVLAGLPEHATAANTRLAGRDGRQLRALLLLQKVHLLVNKALWHRLNGQTAVQLHDLALEILVLQLKELVLTLQVEYNMLLRVDLYNRLVLNVHCACRVIQCRNCLVGVRL